MMAGNSNNYKVCFDCSKPIVGGPSASPAPAPPIPCTCPPLLSPIPPSLPPPPIITQNLPPCALFPSSQSNGPSSSASCASQLAQGSYPDSYVWKWIYANGISGTGSYTQKGYGWEVGGKLYNNPNKKQCSSSCQEVRPIFMDMNESGHLSLLNSHVQCHGSCCADANDGVCPSSGCPDNALGANSAKANCVTNVVGGRTPGAGGSGIVITTVSGP